MTQQDTQPPVETRDQLTEHEQMHDAQKGCVACALCGGHAVITDAGPGAGYYVQCSNSKSYKKSTGCLIDQRRLGGWAYNVMDWWNRLHTATLTRRAGGDEAPLAGIWYDKDGQPSLDYPIGRAGGDVIPALAVAADSLLATYRAKYVRERGGIRENAPFRAEFGALAAALNDYRLATLTRRAGGNAIPAGEEAVSALRDLLVIAGTPITERQERVLKRARAIVAAGDAPSVRGATFEPPAGGDAGAVAALIQWARDQMALPDGSGWLGGHIDENHRYKLRDLVGAIDAALALPAPVVEGDLAWLGSDTRLSLEHYSPVYGDDDDQSREWRVHRESGSINDRIWDIVGRGSTPHEAIAAARAALSEGRSHG